MSADPDLLVRIGAVAEHTGLDFGVLQTVDGLRKARLLELAGHGRRTLARGRFEQLRTMGADIEMLVAAARAADLPAPPDFELDVIADGLDIDWEQVDDVVPRFDGAGHLTFEAVSVDDRQT